MSKMLQNVLDVVSSGGPKALRSALEPLPGNTLGPLADEARQAMKQALRESRGNDAMALAAIAALAYAKAGNVPESLRHRYHLQRLLFMAAGTFERYLELRSDFIGIAADAQQAGVGDVYFGALMSAADCLYWARTVAPDQATATQLHLETLQMLLAVTVAAKKQTGHKDFPIFTSLLAGACHEADREFWSGIEAAKVKVLLDALGVAAESLVPDDCEFPGSPERTVGNARLLAELSFKHGTPAKGSRRLEIAIDAAKAAGDLDTWMMLLGDLYRGLRDSGVGPERLAPLRRDMARNAEPHRAERRSRAGRLQRAQSLDLMLGDAVGDAVLEAATDPAELFAMMDALKGRLLVDRLAGLERFIGETGAANTVAELERRVLRFNPEPAWDLLESELKLISMLQLGTLFESPDWEMIGRLEEAYREYDAGLVGVSAPCTLAEVQHALRPDELLVEYYIPRHPLHPAKALAIFAVSREDIHVIPVTLGTPSGLGLISTMIIDGKQPIDSSALGDAVFGVRVAIQRGEDDVALERLKQLWQVLIFPLLEWHYPDEFQRLIIVPHGPLHYVPFAALADPDGTHLVQDVAVTVCPSAAAWLALQKKTRPEVASFLGVADPLIKNSKLPPLKQAHREVSVAEEQLAGLEAETLAGAKATESAVRKAIAGRSIVHFAAHGEFPEEDPIDLHRILLAADQHHDGHLLADELRRMDLHAARLLVLSICDGGLYRFGPGDEPYGLIPAVLAAGAENVVAPLWAVEDSAALKHMTAFYSGFLGHGPAGAMRQACMRAITDRVPLKHWAGFVNTGPGRPVTTPAVPRRRQARKQSARR